MSTTGTDTLVYNAPEVNFGTTTSWIPLTTAWPSSTGCASSFYLHPGQPYPYGWDPGLGYFLGQTQKCQPAAVTAWHEQGNQHQDGFTRLSIRPIVCPAAYTTAVTSINSVSSTMVVCCPSSYDLIGYESGRTEVSTSDAIVTTSLAVTSSTSINAIIISGWNVATATSTLSTTLLASQNPTKVPPTASGGLLSGAKAGIGIGVTLGAVGILSLIGAFFLLRRRQKTTQYDPMSTYPQHADSSDVHEMPDQHHLAEMPQEPAELSSVNVKK
ncbi:hypothetical protein FKW77_001191 [Venturia effusa]|uniref:Mid2 domain-containing protein n=1 Tax=Venturia effusa TaxID=50376 RepID=A0A517LNB8_9PEZI|nr:hypothetical protein FKW77_001191 [Venturia effusa]